jgi:hypothetical protein
MARPGTLRVPERFPWNIGEFLHAADLLDEKDRNWRLVPVARQVARNLLGQDLSLREQLGFETIKQLDSQRLDAVTTRSYSICTSVRFTHHEEGAWNRLRSMRSMHAAIPS